MASIPSSIISDILSQLPVKSLVRFKTLNKLCHSFITNPQFILTHFKNGANKPNADLSLILSCTETQNLDIIVHFFTLKDLDEVAVLEYSVDVPVSCGGYKVLPSCNGLVCFYSLRGGVYVCNPSTKDIVRLPDIDAEGFRSLSYGFGFDEIRGKHKVIQFLEPRESTSFGNYRIEIFTMGDNSWRTIGYHSRIGVRKKPVFAGGFFYWIKVTRGLLIVSFDIGNEIFEDISPPEGFHLTISNCLNLYLVGLRGELCLVDPSLSAGKRMDIWTLKRDVVEKKENWVRTTIVHQSEKLGLSRPVAFINEEMILLRGYIRGVSDFFHAYNLQTGYFWQVRFNGTPWEYFTVSHHVESLFPVNINPRDNM